MSECTNCEPCAMIPFAASEAQSERLERTNKRMFIIILLLVILLVGTNMAWLWYESQFETIETYEEVIVDSEGGGNANYIGEDGDIYNGEGNGQEEDNNESKEG